MLGHLADAGVAAAASSGCRVAASGGGGVADCGWAAAAVSAGCLRFWRCRPRGCGGGLSAAAASAGAGWGSADPLRARAPALAGGGALGFFRDAVPLFPGFVSCSGCEGAAASSLPPPAALASAVARFCRTLRSGAASASCWCCRLRLPAAALPVQCIGGSRYANGEAAIDEAQWTPSVDPSGCKRHQKISR